MGRKSRQDVCKICGGLASKINYVSGAKGKTYHYSKYVHSNGVVHYFRENPNTALTVNASSDRRLSVHDALEVVVDVKMREKELRFGEIKALLDDSYGRPVGVATVYRNINKLLRLGLINKKAVNGVVLYSKKSGDSPLQEMKATKMSIGFDFTQDKTFVTVFVHVKNLGLRLITGIPMSLPVGAIDSLNSIRLTAFDETRRIALSKENIAYSYPGRTGISITPNKPLRKSDEGDFFLNYSYNTKERLIKTNLLSDTDFLKVSCEVPKGKDVEIKKILVDGLKEIEPMVVRRTGTELGYAIVEAEFENATRGDTIVVLLGD